MQAFDSACLGMVKDNSSRCLEGAGSRSGLRQAGELIGVIVGAHLSLTSVHWTIARTLVRPAEA
jgi:hypothetical protein